MRNVIIAVAAITISILSGCVYKPNIQQGNVLNQKEINQIRPGMTKEQVRFVLGNPVLNTNLENNTWYYLYYLIPSRGDRIEKRMILTFEDDKLATIQGTEKPEIEE
ncbi:outer membrane protein assembly factor BamE [Kangiella sp. HZ709]|uniref:outer membrane protein assembly factor BamE n=1 Tax=Kangiella sp. HZ709 TaxID=2666328 RepID=UPI0012B10FD4|nr:outer membrane protein assembly factor BamE [Kangiella sp. HZ709]MRX27816.1 outer membrane protein assembly factor BamE [Kangiella sp. HZ709]